MQRGRRRGACRIRQSRALTGLACPVVARAPARNNTGMKPFLQTAEIKSEAPPPIGDAEFAALMLERKDADNSKTLLCPMPGLVKSISVRVDQQVKAGEPLCMVEAMKMENVLVAERDVTIKKILAKEGDSLAVDAVIMEFA